MRKQLKVLLLVAIVAVLFVMAMIVGSAAETEVADGTALTQAVNTANAGDTIKLTANITLSETLVVNKPITIDGQGQYTITSTVASGFMIQLTAAEAGQTVALKNLSASVEAAGFVQFFGNGTFVFENVTATCGGQLIYSGGASDNAFMGYTMEITGCTLTSTMTAKTHMFGHAKNHINGGATPVAGVTPATTVTVTNTTITAATVGGNIFKFEYGTLTLDSCSVNAPDSILLYSDSYGSHFVVKSESAPYQSAFTVKGFSYLRGIAPSASLTIGRENNDDNIQVNASDYIILARKLLTYTIHGGTFTSTGAGAMFQGGIAGLALTINNANIVSSGAPVVGAYSAAAAAWTFKYCEFAFAGTNAGFMAAENTAAVTANYDSCVFVVSAAPADVALFGANETLDTAIVLAPAGAKLTADKALDTYANTVKYGGADYKLYAAIAGAFENSAEAGAGLYVDSTADASGLRFETTISKTYIDELLAATGKTIADLKFYTLIAPMDYVAAAGGIFTKDMLDSAPALASVATKYVAIEAENSLAGIEGVAVVSDITYNGALVSLNSYTRAYAAVSMIEYVDGGDTVTLYGDFDSIDNARAAKQVADNMIADATSDYNTVWAPATAPQAAVVEKYATGIVD